MIVLGHAETDENLNETLESVFKNIEASAQGTDSEANFKGLFYDIDVNSNFYFFGWGVNSNGALNDGEGKIIIFFHYFA